MIIPIVEGRDSLTPRSTWTRSEGGEEVPQEVIWGPIDKKDEWILTCETSDFCYISFHSFLNKYLQSHSKPSGARCRGYSGEEEGLSPAPREQA